jgi:hypothetical protein
MPHQIFTVIPTVVSVADANDVELPVSHPPKVLYIPDFLDALVEDADDSLTYETTHKCLLLKNWLTHGLTSEMRCCFPTADQNDKSTGARDLEGFKTNCSQLPPQGPIFASHKQVEQAAKLFLDAWSISSSCIGMKIVCFYRSHLNVLKTHPTTLTSPACAKL